MPTYEPKPDHLNSAIRSILAQTETDWSLFIHDDASTTNVETIIKPLLTDARITYARSSKRLGIAGNWNACLKTTNAPSVQFLFQDDLWEPEYLHRSFAALQQDPFIVLTAAHHTYKIEGSEDTAFLYAEVLAERQKVLRAGNIDGHTFLMQWIQQGLRPNLIGEPSFVMMRRDAVMKAGTFHANLPQLLDSEYWTRLLQIGDMAYLPKNLGTFRVHDSGASSQNDQSGSGIYDRLLCLHKLSRSLKNREDRRITKTSMAHQVDGMIEKYMQRKASGKEAGGGGMKRIPISCYPMLAAGLMRYFLRRR